MSSRIFTEIQAADPLVPVLLHQDVRHPVLPIKHLISFFLRLWVLPVSILYVPIIYLAHPLALDCKLIVLLDSIHSNNPYFSFFFSLGRM